MSHTTNLLNLVSIKWNSYNTTLLLESTLDFGNVGLFRIT
jgi:hypothetical protein